MCHASGVAAADALQASTRATVTGVVLDSLSQAPLAHANIVAAAQHRGAIADTLGRFTLRDLAPGAVRITAALVGYASSEITLTLAGGERRDVTIHLARAPIPQSIVHVRDAR